MQLPERVGSEGRRHKNQAQKTNRLMTSGINWLLQTKSKVLRREVLLDQVIFFAFHQLPCRRQRWTKVNAAEARGEKHGDEDRFQDDKCYLDMASKILMRKCIFAHRSIGSLLSCMFTGTSIHFNVNIINNLVKFLHDSYSLVNDAFWLGLNLDIQRAGCLWKGRQKG